MDLPVVHACRLHAFQAVWPWCGIDIAHPIADPFLFRVKFNMMARRNLKSNSLAGRFELARRNVIYFAAEIRNRFGQAFECRFVVDLECDVIRTGYIRLTEYDAVVILLVPRLDIHSSLVVPIGFNEPYDLGVMLQCCFYIQNTE